MVVTPVKKVRLQLFDLLLIFSIKVKVMGVETQTVVPGTGFCEQVKPKGGVEEGR